MQCQHLISHSALALRDQGQDELTFYNVFSGQPSFSLCSMDEKHIPESVELQQSHSKAFFSFHHIIQSITVTSQYIHFSLTKSPL